MDLRIRAVGRTAGLMAIWTLVPLAVIQLFQLLNLSNETIGYISIAILVAGFTWLVYSVNLGQLKWEEACKESSTNLDELQKKLSK